MSQLKGFLLPLALAAIVMAGHSCSDSTSSTLVGAARILPKASVQTQIPSAIDNSSISLGESHENFDEASTLTISSADGHLSKSWTPFSSYFPAEAVLAGGYKVSVSYGTPLSEGFDAPYIFAEQNVELKEGEETEVELSCALSNVLSTIDFDSSIAECFGRCDVIMHSNGGSFITCPVGEKRRIYLRPGDIKISVDLQFKDSRECSFEMGAISDAKGGRWYPLSISVENGESDAPVIKLSGAANNKVVLTRQFVSTPSPEFTCSGFTSGVPLTVAEGMTPSFPVKVSINREGISHIFLSTVAPSLIARGWPAEANLLNPDDASALHNSGLTMASEDGKIVIDFTKVIPLLRDTDGRYDAFSLQAVTPAGKVSAPVILNMDISPVDVAIKEVTAPVIGIDTAELKIKCDEPDAQNNLSLQIREGESWKDLPITSITAGENHGLFTLTFKVPPGTTPVDIRLLYCSSVRGETTLRRLSPQYALQVDAFAMKAAVRIMAEDEALVSTIARLADFYTADGKSLVNVSRDMENGLVWISGLNQRQTYSIKASVLDNPAQGDFSPLVTFTTESASPLPNGNFEDVDNKPTTYRDMPSGGRYSQNIAEIFNLQNYTSFSFMEPLKWANTNAKTFCMRAKRMNTWYVAPSVRIVDITQAYGGTSYATRIDNVGWDIDGPAIPDYLQEGQPYTKYSRNIPRVAHKAVGKIFLGEYSFNSQTGEEKYAEGMDFPSRPAALNGFYRYLPSPADPDDTGLVVVEVVGSDNETIAAATIALPPATGYTAFTVPLTYSAFGKKAASVKVMIAASATIGNIDYETSHTPAIADPVTATVTGSSLWVDELTFSY